MAAPGNAAHISPGARYREDIAGPRVRSVREWKVVHAAEDSSTVLSLVEAQSEVGMKPAVLTRTGWLRPGSTPAFSAPASLVQQWREVRRWRDLLAAEDVGRCSEIVHAHCFTAGMAAVRADVATVYDVQIPAGTALQDAEHARGGWLLGSLGVAENYVLQRASAVVVHSSALWEWAVGKGMAAGDLFLVPHPVSLPIVSSWSAAHARTGPLTLFAAVSAHGSPEPLNVVLRALAILADEFEMSRLVLQTDAVGICRTVLNSLHLEDRVEVTRRIDLASAPRASSLVIASDADPATVLAAMSYGLPLLAPDVPALRDIAGPGTCCLWYQSASERDLAFRAAFLARNPEFAARLGGAGRAHLEHTRAPAAVAFRYDAVYRHALRRHRSGPHSTLLIPAPALQLV